MKTINILGVDYTIRQIEASKVVDIYKDKLHLWPAVKELIGEQGENFGGLCDISSATIWIDKDLNPKKKEKTLLHEIMEAVNQELQGSLDHLVIQGLTNALFLSGRFNIKDLLDDDETNFDDIDIDRT